MTLPRQVPHLTKSDNDDNGDKDNDNQDNNNHGNDKSNHNDMFYQIEAVFLKMSSQFLELKRKMTGSEAEQLFHEKFNLKNFLFIECFFFLFGMENAKEHSRNPLCFSLATPKRRRQRHGRCQKRQHRVQSA